MESKVERSGTDVEQPAPRRFAKTCQRRGTDNASGVDYDSAMQAKSMKLTTPSDREVVVTREFDVPRRLIFECLTNPRLLQRWLGVQNGWTLAQCEIDLKVGGNFRYEWRGPEGEVMKMRGIYREIVRPERIVNTEQFVEPSYSKEAIDTTVLVDDGRQTTMTLTILYGSKEIRDAMLKTPMEKGMAASYDKLDELLVTLENDAAP